MVSRLRCFYHPEYFLALPQGHPFPMEKFPQAREILENENAPITVLPVAAASSRVLLRVHTSGYLRKLTHGNLEPSQISKLGLPWSARLLYRSSLETGGTIAACNAALRYGMAANLAGGTHHAFPDRGLGYCVLNDVAVAVRDLHVTQTALRVFVADTDAHQGNGTHFIFAGDERVFTYSIHGERNYPSTKEPGSLDVGLPRQVAGDDYLSALSSSLPDALDQFVPDLVIWISGADVHAEDRFGQMELTTEQMLERDRRVMIWCTERSIPLAVLYGGGYHRTPGMTARLHANTILLAAETYQQINARHESEV